jgi:hypothetical protein
LHTPRASPCNLDFRHLAEKGAFRFYKNKLILPRPSSPLPLVSILKEYFYCFAQDATVDLTYNFLLEVIDEVEAASLFLVWYIVWHCAV